MFYKYDFDPAGKSFIENNPLEFSKVLQEKFKYFPEYSTGFLKATDTNGNHQIIKPVLYNTKKLSFFAKNGERDLNRYCIDSLSKKHPGLSDFRLEIDSLSDLPTNSGIKSEMEKLLADFFNVKVKKEVKDREGHQYHIKVVSNADDTIGNSLIVDTLFLFDKEQQVGYLKVKHTKKEYIKKIYGSLNCDDAKSDKLFLNKAGVDYSKLEEKYQNKGLGYVMYFHMAQHLENEGIKFRASTLQSDLAQRLWNGINKNWNAHIEKKMFNKKSCVFLKMTNDLELYFENNLPKIKKLTVKI